MSEPIGVRQTGSAPFRARARLIRLLGEELISDEVMAVVELVKNGYDADARRVTIELMNGTDVEQGTIRIRDDGSGMDLHTVLHSWMEPATTRKRTRGSQKVRSPLGRIQLGEKGVGRFAADKLGSELELTTRLSGSEDETVLRVGWHHFDHDRYLDEVENTWVTREPSEFAGEQSGTLLVIRSLRAAWDEEKVSRLQNGLRRLVSPTANTSDFVIEIVCPEFPFFSGHVVNRLITTSPYRLTGTVDATGVLIETASNRVIDLRKHSPDLFKTPSGELRAPCCGPFFVSLNVWDLEPQTGNGFGVDKMLRQEIKASAGVSIYRDNFRIWPYGERDDDWLELNQRRVNNPTMRISNNQIIGFVEITDAGNPELRDRTSREGLLETPAFFDLKFLVLGAVSELETERFARRRPSVPRVPQTSPAEDEILSFMISMRSGAPGGGATTLRAQLQEIERLYRQHLDQERARYNHVSRLAGVGMAAELLTSSFSREVLNATTVLHIVQGEVLTTGNARLLDLIDELVTRMDTLNEQLDLMEPLYRPSLQETESVNLGGAIYDVTSILADHLEDARIRVSCGGNRRLSVRINRGHLMQVLMILLENAIQILIEARTPDPRIDIQILTGEGMTGLRISDNGPGIPPGVQKLIFEPYFSTRQAGRGLGLHVARDILASYNSTLQLIPETPAPPGACFEVRFDRRRVGERPD